MSTSARLAAAFAVAAPLFLLALPASAADLYDPRRAGSPYDDPRYADIYGDGPAYNRDADRDDYEADDAPRAAYKDFNDDEDDDDGPAYAPYRRGGRYGDACVPRHVVRDRLRDEGWRDLERLERRDEVVLVRARRPSGRLFDLTIDRCSGEVVDARPLTFARDYAYGSRRYGRSY
jgi:hypothetical protein